MSGAEVLARCRLAPPMTVACTLAPVFLVPVPGVAGLVRPLQVVVAELVGKVRVVPDVARVSVNVSDS